MLAVFALGALLGRLLHRSPPEVMVMQALNACFSNTGYMGIPLFIAAFGPQGVAPAALATVVMSAVMVGLAVVALELAGASGKGVAAALGDVVRALGRNPLVVAPLAGLALSALGAPLPRPLVTFSEITGAAAGPCALFAIGLFLAGRPLTGQLGEVAWITALKLVVQPALCWWLATRVFAMEPEWAAAAVILAALPTGALTFVVAQQYRTYVEKTSTAILVTTVVSTVTLSFVLAAYVPG
jgi:predicted permease